MPKAPVMLIVLDGFGINPNKEGNAIALANRPTFKKLEAANHSQILASGESVGLPKDQMGNSEVGHTNIGAGRIVLQDFPRITKDIETENIFKNPVLEKAIAEIKRHGCTVSEFFADNGNHSDYDGGEVLAWLGY